MTNLFDAIKKLSDEELREQVALFEVFKVANVYKDAGHKVAKKLVKATNVVTGFMKKTPLQEPEGFSIEEALQKHKTNRQEETREHLELALKMLLAERCEMPSDVSEDALSVAIIDEAGETYHLKEELMPAQKADWIARYYQEEVKATNEACNDKNNAYALLKIQMPLGNTKILRYLFVQLIAASVEAYGGQMTIKKEQLPSWLPTHEKEELRQAYQNMLRMLAKNKEAYEHVMQKFLENNQRTAAKKKLIEEEEHKQEAIKACIDKLEKEIENEVVEKEIHMKKTHLTSYKATLEMSKEDIKRAAFYIERGEQASTELSKEIENALKKKEETSQLMKEERDTRNELREVRWEVAYSSFTFELNGLEYIRQHFNENEILDCERVLMELHQMTDREAVSWGEVDEEFCDEYKIDIKDKKLEHLLFSFANNEVGMLVYERIENEPYKINIVRIVKLREE